MIPFLQMKKSRLHMVNSLASTIKRNTKACFERAHNPGLFMIQCEQYYNISRYKIYNLEEGMPKWDTK